MRYLTILFSLLVLIGNAYAWGYDFETQPVDLMPLEAGWYTSATTVSSSVSAIPEYGNFDGRRNITITNCDDYASVYLVNSPTLTSITQAYNLLPGNSISMDIGDNVTDCSVYGFTSESTVTVSVTTVEVR